MNSTTLITPSIPWVELSPILVVVVAAIVSVFVEAFVPRKARHAVQLAMSIVAVAVAAGWAGALALSFNKKPSKAGTLVFGGDVVIDRAGLFLQFAVLAAALIAVLVVGDRIKGDDAFAAQASSVPGSLYEEESQKAGLTQTEVFPLVLLSTAGMTLFPVAGDLITMFVALEVVSLPLYILTGMARRRRLLSQEAALKYFLLGAFASAFFLFGAAWVYGATGSVRFGDIATAIMGGQLSSGLDWALLLGFGLVAVGLFFKISAVPFHSWAPDVYQGAPTPISGLMAACTKVAAFGALLRILYVVGATLNWDVYPMIWAVAILTMIVGTIIGVAQHDIKRLLAYSAISHVGFMLAGASAFLSTRHGYTSDGLVAVLFYLFTYGIATVGAFGVVYLIRERDKDGNIQGEVRDIDRWAGLGRRHPVMAGAFTVFILSFAGIPFTAGFVGKFAVFSAAGAVGGWPLVITGIACSAVTAFFYFKVVVSMYVRKPDSDTEASGMTVVAVRGTGLTLIAIAVALVVTIGLGVFPSALLGFLHHAGNLAFFTF